MKKFLRLIGVFLGVLFFVVFCLNTVSAMTLGGLDTTAGGAGYTQKDLLAISGNTINKALSFVGVLFLIMMIVGGFIWMTAAGNDARVKTAMNLIVAGIIGFIIVVGAYVITTWLGNTFKQ